MSATGDFSDFVEASEERASTGLPASGLEAGGSDASDGLSIILGLGAFLGCWSRCKALEAAELPLR